MSHTKKRRYSHNLLKFYRNFIQIKRITNLRNLSNIHLLIDRFKGHLFFHATIKMRRIFKRSVNHRESSKFLEASARAFCVKQPACTDANRTRTEFEIGDRSISFRRTIPFRRSAVTIVHARDICGKLLRPNIVRCSDNCLSNS